LASCSTAPARGILQRAFLLVTHIGVVGERRWRYRRERQYAFLYQIATSPALDAKVTDHDAHRNAPICAIVRHPWGDQMTTCMRRREFITLLGGAAAAWPVAARAQQSKTRLWRVGWLVTGSPASHQYSLAAFRDGLRALNYVEGQNTEIMYKWAEGNMARLPELANELVQQHVDVILAGGTAGARAAKNATLPIPIVTAGAGDLVQAGLVTSLAKPGGNWTGFIVNAAEGGAKRLQIMKEIVAKAEHAAILFNSTLELQVVKESASDLRLALHLYETPTLGDLEIALATIPKNNPDVLVVLNDPLVFTHRKRIVDAAKDAHLPAIYGFREFVDDGGLISYGASISDTYRRSAGYVDRILKGAKPADLPLQLPIKFELIINLKTAKALGLEVPPTLLARADEVIE
jgi:putative tryptophan/tyrosine transport system substrate-binding protein